MMADDDMAVLLQTAIAEMQASRKQTEALVSQNQQLMEQNRELNQRMKTMAGSSKSRKSAVPKIEVSVHTKVKCVCEWWLLIWDGLVLSSGM